MGTEVNTNPKKSLDTAKVQILLEGEDARLYKQIINKKQFLVAAMKMFAQDKRLRLIEKIQ